MDQQSLAQAFVRFLETESSPRVAVTLPAVDMARNKEEQLSRSSPRGSTSSPGGHLPLLMSPMPSLSHTPSILKSVLDEEEARGSGDARETPASRDGTPNNT